MKVDKLFQVLVVAGAASTVGLVACGDDEGGEEEGTGGSGSSSGGASATGGGSATGGESSSTGGESSSTGGESGGDNCDAVCHPSEALASWTDCNGCCCWLPIGQTTTRGSPICGEEPCCEVGDNGR